jgi:Transglycosylase SLT domain
LPLSLPLAVTSPVPHLGSCCASDRVRAVVINDRRRTPILGIALAIGALMLVSLMPAVRAPATPPMRGAAQEAELLQGEVVRLFDRLDQISRAIEGARADAALARERITGLSGQIDAQQEMVNRYAADAYMGRPAAGVEALLGARSFTDFQDALAFLDAVSRREREVLVSLQHRKTEVERQRVRLEALEAKLLGTRERLETTVADLVEKLERQRDLLRERAEEGGTPSVNGSIEDPAASPPPPSPSPPSPVPGRGAVTELIRDRFASLGSRTAVVALCVAERESGLDPLAVNPDTGAAGLFQFLPSTWATLSEMAGRGDASVLDAEANVAVAAWTVAHYGWHPWRSVAEDCGN